jgi:hypothetical protein
MQAVAEIAGGTMSELPETLARLAVMPAFVADALARGAGRHDARPAAGGFSLVEHACHLRDLECEGYLARVKRLLSAPGVALEPFHGDRVAEERNYLSQDAVQAARAFAAARAELIGILVTLGPADLAREGTFAGSRVTLEEIVAMAAGHDAEHRADIERLLVELA